MHKIISHFFILLGLQLLSTVAYSNPSNMPKNGLVAYFPFNGNATDSSGNENDGIVNGALLVSDRYGNINSAYYFNGSSDYIEVPDNPSIDLTNQISICVWYKTDLPILENQVILGKGRSFALTGLNLGIYQGFPAFGLNDGQGQNHSSIYNTQVIDGWHFLTATYDGQTLKIYVDGDLKEQLSATLSLQNSDIPLNIGRETNGLGRYFAGIIDDIRIYNRPLSDLEILKLYKENLYNGLVAYYPFNSNAIDESENGNDGSVIGAQLVSDRYENSNSAYYFNGSSDYIEVQDNPSIDLTNKISICAWYKTDLPIQENQMILGKGRAFALGGYNFGIFQGGPTFGLNDGQGQNFAAWYSTPVIDGWHFLCGTYDGQTLKTFVDGELKEQVSATLSVQNSEIPLNIGRETNGLGRYFAGSIDDIRIYNRPLTDSEIWDLSLETSNTLPVELVDLHAIISENNIRIVWKTISESNNYGFKIQQFTPNGTDSQWEDIGFVHGFGTTKEENDYFFDIQFHNSSKPGSIKLRLMQIDLNGSYFFSQILDLKFQQYSFDLLPAYPNPFNPTTTLKFNLASKENVNLVVYDILGREVAILLKDKVLEANTYSIELNGNSLTSGVYFVQLKAGLFTKITKVALVK